uniref:probable galacturonosyltransferase 3 isoform X1 n=1 Tax=Fragaria vesca subsp. vesca TaxID=101020 RepID=UPI0005C95A00|nr:PREDICTED: probable galacturonosyltransferase 3 isoform X1 [Fragaria vesca subsp. vesca]
MAVAPTSPSTFHSLLFLLISLLMQVVFLFLLVGADASTIQRDISRYHTPCECEQCLHLKEEGESSVTGTNKLLDEKNIDIIATYSNNYGAVQSSRVKVGDLSASWVLENPIDGRHGHPKSVQVAEDSFQSGLKVEEKTEHSTDDHQSGEGELRSSSPSLISPVKHKRQLMREERRKLRTAELMGKDKEANDQMAEAAINRTKSFDTIVTGKYSIWRRDYENPNSDSTLKLMRDQIIMAIAYANIAKSKNESVLYNSLMKNSKLSQNAIGEATTDAELPASALNRAKSMGRALSVAKDKLYDCHTMETKLRAMLQSTEDNVNGLKKKSAFLIQLAAKTVPKPLHCLPLQLASDYFLLGYSNREDINKEKLEDPSLYHYAIFSDNVLATSVVVNSTVLHAKEPNKHVFHVVTDKLNYAAMRMWFLVNPPAGAAVQVQNIDDFKWLNSSSCSVLRQLESARLQEYYFKANHPSSLSLGSDQLKYRNPKYLSLLNHLRFYLPDVYPKLDKILFLDDDVVVQKELTPLWSIDLQGMVNGAVETCKESFHRYDKYLNFSNPIISANFDPNACGWAFGMNMFDLKEWRKRNMTGVYHKWQDMNEERTLWKLGTLPPGLITFYNLTYPLDRGWHSLGLGYDPALNQTAIENAAVIHYNGNYKPWLDLAISKYKNYWSKYVMYDNPYLRICNINP